VAAAFTREKAAGLRRTAGDALSDLGDARAVRAPTPTLTQTLTLTRTLTPTLTRTRTRTQKLKPNPDPNQVPLAAAALTDGAALVRWRAARIPGDVCMHTSMHIYMHMHAHTQVRWRAARILGELGEGTATLAALKQASDTHANADAVLVGWPALAHP